MHHQALHFILLIVLLIAVMTDLKSFKIPNWLTIPAMMTGLLGHAFINGLTGMVFSLKGLGLGLALFFVLYAMGGMGAGDVKLLAAVGSFIGAEDVLSAGLMAMFLGGLYAIAMMIFHMGMRGSLKQMGALLKSWISMPRTLDTSSPAQVQPQLRYALVIGLGTLMSQWMGAPFVTF